MLRSIVLCAALLALATPLRAEIVHVDSAGLQRLLAEDVAVVDIRTPEEWRETGTIEGSHLLTFFDADGDHDLGAWLQTLDAVAGAGQPVALICHGGKRSLEAARLLDAQPGDRRVYNVRRGVWGWIAEELRKALEEARAEAILDPTPAKVAAYLRLQQETLAKAAAFSDAFRRTVWATPELDYTLRRPVGALAKQVWSDQRRQDRDAALARLGERYGLIYLGHAGCAGCRVIAETMAKLRALAQWVNSQNLNSCETAQALVGALWSKNDRASSAICAAIGTGQGIFSDYAAAKHGCGADGRRNSTLASASGAMADQVPVNVNYAWKAIRASSFLAGDTQLAEFAMAVTGTLIVTAPTSDADASGPRVRILEPLALDRRVTEVLMEGGGALPVYLCDTPDACLNPSLGTVTIPANRGFRARVASLLRDLVDAVRTDNRPAGPGPRPREPHHAAGLPGRQRGGGLPGRRHRPGDGRARRGRGARRHAGLESRTCTAPSRSAPAPWTSPTANSCKDGARG